MNQLEQALIHIMNEHYLLDEDSKFIKTKHHPEVNDKKIVLSDNSLRSEREFPELWRKFVEYEKAHNKFVYFKNIDCLVRMSGGGAGGYCLTFRTFAGNLEDCLKDGEKIKQ